MKKVLDELYKLKFSLTTEIETLRDKIPANTTNDYDGGVHIGKLQGRLEAKEFDLLRLDQIICDILK